jgi:hypothetical protein
MHGNGRYGLQCLTNLDQLPPTGAIIVCPPLKIRQGSGSPLRVLALLEEGDMPHFVKVRNRGARGSEMRHVPIPSRSREKGSVPSRARRARHVPIPTRRR